MAIQWYPGHMFKARKKIKESIAKIDIVIEVLDARIPFSSENPMVAQLRQKRPCIKVLNKSDLANPATTKEWIQHFNKEKGVKAIAVVGDKKGPTRSSINDVISLCKTWLPERNYALKPVRIMILGIPNVGKSTIINALSNKSIARVGNEPAITKAQQFVHLEDGVLLCDTPGILWPKIEDEGSGYRLAITGAIKNTAIEFEDVAMYAAGFFMEHFPEQVKARYQLEELPATDVELLEAVGRKRGGLRAGGHIDMNKASEVFLHDYRANLFGSLTLETPAMLLALQQAKLAAASAADNAEE